MVTNFFKGDFSVLNIKAKKKRISVMSSCITEKIQFSRLPFVEVSS
jgi:hypothetical protein